MTSYTTIGQASPRLDGREKVTGEALYTADVSLPGTLWGVALRSPYPHARILSVDISKALQVPGVHAVLTGRDVRGIRYGRRLYDVPILAEDSVRFIGERVAAVAAVDRDAAAEALLLIDVEYQELPGVFDPAEALEEGAPILHPEVNSYAGLPRQLAQPTNCFAQDAWSKGDVDQGFAESDIVVENTFSVPRQHQAYLETHSCLVWIDDEGRVQIWASSKVPYPVKQQLSNALGLPEERIRINPVNIGGDFGGKGSPMNIPLAYFLAVRTGRPVKMVMDYAEEFIAGNPRHSALVEIKTGVKQDGTLVALQAKVIFNSGAYGGFKPAPGVNLGGAAKAGGPYRVPHLRVDALQVYTNTVPGGFMRAPGEPQAAFAAECQMDIVAQRLGMNPMQFRQKNLLQEGDENPLGAVYTGIKARETLEAAVSASNYNAPQTGEHRPRHCHGRPPHCRRGVPRHGDSQPRRLGSRAYLHIRTGYRHLHPTAKDCSRGTGSVPGASPSGSLGHRRRTLRHRRRWQPGNPGGGTGCLPSRRRGLRGTDAGGRRHVGLARGANGDTG